MLEVKRDDGVWIQFYVIKHLEWDGEGDVLHEVSLSELPTRVYGKFVGGICGYQPWWVYTTVDKSELREKKLNTKSTN